MRRCERRQTVGGGKAQLALMATAPRIPESKPQVDDHDFLGLIGSATCWSTMSQVFRVLKTAFILAIIAYVLILLISVSTPERLIFVTAILRDAGVQAVVQDNPALLWGLPTY